MDIDKQTIEDLKAQYGVEELVLQETRSGPFLFRGPSRLAYNRYINETTNAKKSNQAEAMAALCDACLVHPVTADSKPDRAALAAAIEKEPGIPLDAQGDIMALAGVDTTSVKKV